MQLRGAYRRLLRLICLTLPAAALAWQTGEQRSGWDNSTNHVVPSTGDAWRPVVQGRLKNRLRYAILPRRGNEPGVGLLMRIEGGFIAERRPGERGLTHLIEHLALVSPTMDAPEDLRHFIRIGLPLTFPAASAGTTSWRETNLFLSTRTTRATDLDTLLTLFREVVGEMTLRADAVDDQRADVMREMAGRKLGNVVYANYIAAVAPGSPTDVIDAQNHDDVPTASVETIRALYHRLYRPENVMIVVVGNVDPAKMKALIQRRFGDWRGVGPAPRRVSAPTFRSDRIAPISYSDFRQGRTGVTISVAMPTPAPPADRREQMRSTLMDMVAIRAVNQRLTLAQPDSPPGKTGFFIENGEQGHRLFLLWDNVAPGQWRSGAIGLKRTTCALKTKGFSGPAWAMAKQGVVQELEQRSKDMGAVPNVELAKDLSHALADGRDLIPPDKLLRYARIWLPVVGEKTGSDWWRRQWRAGVEHIRVESPELAQVKEPQAAIRAALAEADPSNDSCELRSP